MENEVPDIHSGSTDEEIVAYICHIKAKHPADPQIAAKLAQTLASSGDFIKPRILFSADVASTGGPSSLSTLLCPLYLHAAGAVVPKLGVPGRPAGGVDCLSQIDGYRSNLDTVEVEKLLDEFGYAHFLAGDRLAPLDARMFKLRQQNGAQAVPTLVTASLLSKKLAVGVRRAGLDIRVAPHGNFGRSWPEATKNARLFIEAALLLSIEAFPVLTDARYPYQPFIGRSEALLALHHLFSGNASAWLEEHRVLCRDIAVSCTPIERRVDLLNTTSSDLRDHFYLNLVAQGGSSDIFERLVESTASRHTHMLRACEDGFVRFELSGIRQVLVDGQQRSARTGAKFPDPIGLILLRRPGEWVEKNEPLATVRIDNGNFIEVIGMLERHISNTLKSPLGPMVEGMTWNE